MAGKTVRVRSWSELPEVLEPGVYEVDGERIVVKERVERDFVEMAVRGVKTLHRKYYGRPS